MIDAIIVTYPKKTEFISDDGTKTEVSSSTPLVRET